jgi:hypothetical protein
MQHQRFGVLFNERPKMPVVNRALVQPKAPVKKTVKYEAPAPVGNLSAIHPVTAIIRTCAQLAGMLPESIVAPSRKAREVAIRQIAMWLSYRTGRYPLKELGRRFKRDHTTVLHAVKQVDKLLHDVEGVIPADQTEALFKLALDRWVEGWDGKDVRPGRPCRHRVGWQPQQWHLDVLAFLQERGDRGASLNQILVSVRHPYDPRRVSSSTPGERTRKVIETLANHGKVRIVPGPLRGPEPPNMYYAAGGM